MAERGVIGKGANRGSGYREEIICCGQGLPQSLQSISFTCDLKKRN